MSSSSSSFGSGARYDRRTVAHERDHVTVAKLHRGKVHCHAQARQVVLAPALADPAGLGDHPFVDRDDQPRLLGEGEKVEGTHQTPHGMAPADQRLGTDDPPTAQIDLRLVEQFEFLVGEGMAQFRLQG